MTRLSLADQAYNTIKNNILNLTYPPGMPLTESQLADALGMSRNPVRTAIKMLESEGLIVSDYYKTKMVKEITKKDIEEMYQLRELIETEALQLIFSSNRFEEYSYRIEEKVVRMHAVAADMYEWEIADMNMHMEIISILDNSRINRMYEANLCEAIRMGLYSVKNGMHIPKTNTNLKRMVKHMRSGDYDNAYHILKNDHFTIGKSSALRK
ncbi:MAG: GntR family transcriptional regulator [Eubacteriales bacterium]